MKNLILCFLSFVVGCSGEFSSGKPSHEIERVELSTRGSNYRVVQRTVPGGTIYEYHYKTSIPANEVRGFRVFFVPTPPGGLTYGTTNDTLYTYDGITYYYGKYNKK
ncbi:MAG TPA: hypothetical protein ENH82_13090 [bacterium]|nr:hypothetical protein [bacterium]